MKMTDVWRHVPREIPPLPVVLPWLNLLGSALLGLMAFGAWGLLIGPACLGACLALAWLWRLVAGWF